MADKKQQRRRGNATTSSEEEEGLHWKLACEFVAPNHGQLRLNGIVHGKGTCIAPETIQAIAIGGTARSGQLKELIGSAHGRIDAGRMSAHCRHGQWEQIALLCALLHLAAHFA